MAFAPGIERIHIAVTSATADWLRSAGTGPRRMGEMVDDMAWNERFAKPLTERLERVATRLEAASETRLEVK